MKLIYNIDQLERSQILKDDILEELLHLWLEDIYNNRVYLKIFITLSKYHYNNKGDD